ncbi:N-6 DNA methylase [Nonomuraea sp. NPDC046570]|uniref:N-6 DNA methylase n=1 Tax=Nonomuraea sp. NPDC046570 TaxID=3155255 RepID=UPI00340B94E8
MSHDPTVNAGDIARLAGVGRAAVSNWRRRHDDFPAPVGGTAAQPQFALREVEVWLRRYGKSYQVSLGDRAWQRLKAEGDLRLGELVAKAGSFLAGEEPDGLDPSLAALLGDLAVEQGPLGAYEFICERYFEAHSRRLALTRPDVAGLMVELTGAQGRTVLDPACGVGTLLLGVTKAGRLLGQELSATSARIARARLLLRGSDAEIVAADSMREDGFRRELADAVVCDPPFNERSWGYDELTGDPRWEFGLPPRGESELAWVQHCLTHVKPGGLVAVLMPAAAASRRPGRRIRGNLLRAGALRAVVTLWTGGPDLWMLRRPRPGDRPPSEVLIMDAADDLDAVAAAWHDHLGGGHGQAVRIIDLLDDEVDVSPARHVPRGGADLGRAFTAARERFLAASVVPPDLRVLDEPRDHPATTVGELVKAGLVTILQAPPRMTADGGEVPVLLADDVESGAPASGLTASANGLVRVEPGDVVATYSTARVVTEAGAVLGPQLTLYRVDERRLDAHFLAGFLRSAGGRVPAGSSRVDVRRTRLPRLPLTEQRLYGEAFRQLATMEDALREAADLGSSLVRLGLDGLADGRLHPA